MKKQLKRSLALTLSFVLSFTGLPLPPSAHGETVQAPSTLEDIADTSTLEPPQTISEQDIDESYAQADETDASDPFTGVAPSDLDGDSADVTEEESPSEAVVDDAADGDALEVDDNASSDNDALIEDSGDDDALEEEVLESTEGSVEVLESESATDEDVIEVATTDADKANELQSAKETPTKKTLSATAQKNEDAPSIVYRSHIQNIGWQKWKKNGALSGTSKKRYKWRPCASASRTLLDQLSTQRMWKMKAGSTRHGTERLLARSAKASKWRLCASS